MPQPKRNFCECGGYLRSKTHWFRIDGHTVRRFKCDKCEKTITKARLKKIKVVRKNGIWMGLNNGMWIGPRAQLQLAHARAFYSEDGKK